MRGGAICVHLQFSDGVMDKLNKMDSNQALIVEQTRMGMVFAETDATLAYIGALWASSMYVHTQV